MSAPRKLTPEEQRRNEVVKKRGAVTVDDLFGKVPNVPDKSKRNRMKKRNPGIISNGHL